MKNCQVCARSKVSGMSPAVQHGGKPESGHKE
jgi:hypothetical protein